MKIPTYPFVERSHMIEVPCKDRRGRPSYRWEQGWQVTYSETRASTPMRLQEARDILAAEKAKKS